MESNTDVQRGTTMSESRDAVVESHSGARTWDPEKAEADIAFATALCCSEDPQICVIDERPVISSANNDVVIPPSGTVDPAKIEDEDTAEEMYSDAFNDFTTALPTYRRSLLLRTVI